MDNQLKEYLAFVYFGSIVNNHTKTHQDKLEFKINVKKIGFENKEHIKISKWEYRFYIETFHKQ